MSDSAGSFTIRVELVRNPQKRLRIGKVKVRLEPRLQQAAEALGPCLSTFEDFCVVTQSVREGLDVEVEVAPVTG